MTFIVVKGDIIYQLNCCYSDIYMNKEEYKMKPKMNKWKSVSLELKPFPPKIFG